MEEKSRYMDIISLKMPPRGEVPNENDIVQTVMNRFRVDVTEKQDELIMSAVQQIGGTTYQDITIDKSKVIEALGKYVPKRVVVNVRSRIDVPTIVTYSCPICKRSILSTYQRCELDKVRNESFKSEHRYCNFCGQHLDWADAEEACDD